MKRLIAITSVLGLTLGSVFAGIAKLTDAPPPMEMSEANPLAVKAHSTNAAQYHCVIAFPMVTHNYLTNLLTGEVITTINLDSVVVIPSESPIGDWILRDDHVT